MDGPALLERLAASLALTGTHTVPDLIALAKDRRAQVWEGDDALIVTEIIDWPLRRALRFFAVAGSMEGVRALRPTVEEWGREQGCTAAETVARRGWERERDHCGWLRRGGYWVKDLTS